MSTDTMSDMTSTPATPAAAPRSPLARYGRLWAEAPRALLYLLIAFPIGVVGFGVTLALLNAGIGTLVTFFIGVVLLIAALYVARGLGTLELALLRFTKLPPIPRPDWRDDRARNGFLGWIGAVLGNGHYWLHLLWSAVVNFIVTTVTFSIAVTWTATALGGLSYGIWGRFTSPGDVFPAFWLLRVIGLPVEGTDPNVVEVIAYLVTGVVFAVTLPLVLRGLVWAHWGVARGMLGAFRSDALRRQVTDLTASRTAAAAAEGTALRRLERDIHDGPQQRLVRLQMDLAAADRQLDSDPEAARRLLGEALTQSKDALDELRALSRGFAPPILLDRGLVAALESLAARGAVPIGLRSSVPAGTVLPPELERNAYFIVAEAVTNAAKHAGATRVDVAVDVADGRLDLTVTDDGRGGATVQPGHGIANLLERVQGLGGTLALTSPAGGPTIVAASLPVVG
ncbi:sensor histidine kinase [Pseudolysinimonas sp.]|uniref:sensor histidine kinase n=1 Tax=Pseudolysinimonas sp. TaxID=2680009 RepID=UPI003F7E19A1